MCGGGVRLAGSIVVDIAASLPRITPSDVGLAAALFWTWLESWLATESNDVDLESNDVEQVVVVVYGEGLSLVRSRGEGVAEVLVGWGRAVWIEVVAGRPTSRCRTAARFSLR